MPRVSETVEDEYGCGVFCGWLEDDGGEFVGGHCKVRFGLGRCRLRGEGERLEPGKGHESKSSSAKDPNIE